MKHALTWYILVAVIIIGSILIAACEQPSVEPLQSAETPAAPEAQPATSPTTAGNEPEIPPTRLNREREESADKKEAQKCEDTSDCKDGYACVDKRCGRVIELYDTESSCDERCRIKEVELETNSGDRFNFPPGKGTYTGAGAVEWKLASIPDYCPMENPPIAIQVLKWNYGKLLSDEVITLHKGEESEVIAHPVVRKVQFTLKVKDIKEVCQ